MNKSNVMQKRLVINAILALMFISFLNINGFAATSPRLKLFPREVTEHLKNTGRIAKQMETDLKGVILELENQMQLYTASGCENSSDPGCEEIAKQIGEKYNAMLDIMKASLPEMRNTIQITNAGIERNLRKELGKKATPADIQRMLSKKAKPKVYNGRFSLSKRFAKYHRLISSSSKNSLATLAAEIYLDSSEVINFIDLMEAEISREKIIIELGNMYGTLTDEMTSTVDSVKTVIFGEPEGESLLPEATSEGSSGFKSPLEIN